MPEPPTRRLDWGGRPDPDLFERGQDPKGWDRVSIAVNTHPLHPFPRVTQEDFLVPSTGDWLRLVGDCLVFGACMAMLSFFPLWIADVMATGRLANWVWGSMAVAGVLSTLFLFVVASRNGRAYFEPL